MGEAAPKIAENLKPIIIAIVCLVQSEMFHTPSAYFCFYHCYLGHT